MEKNTMYQTEPHFQIIESLNQMTFNAELESALSAPGEAPFPPNFLTDNAKTFFDTASERIADQKFSPLCELMIANRCNKPTAHNYTQFYHELLKEQRSNALNFVEIGIGTPNQDVPSAMGANYHFGASLRGWRSYFDNSATVIRGGDVDPRVLFQEDRINTHYINQLNPVAIHTFLQATGLERDGIDVMLDDGLHQFRSNITLLISVWPFLKRGGIYLIEDMSLKFFNQNISLINDIALGASGVGIALASKNKSDNRIIALQKI